MLEGEESKGGCLGNIDNMRRRGCVDFKYD